VGASDGGVLVLPSGRSVRGRALHRPVPTGTVPDFGLYLLAERPRHMPWEARWVRWPDFRLPVDRDDAVDALHQAWSRAAGSGSRWRATGAAAGRARPWPAWR
jgi:hypothetical protein